MLQILPNLTLPITSKVKISLNFGLWNRLKHFKCKTTVHKFHSAFKEINVIKTILINNSKYFV